MKEFTPFGRIGESNSLICHFSSKGECLALQNTKCKGDLPKTACSFRKTTDEFLNDYHAAIKKNRDKGNCNNCKYRTQKCQLPIMEE